MSKKINAKLVLKPKRWGLTWFWEIKLIVNKTNNSVNILSQSSDIIGKEVTYSVREKETLIDIARKFDISFADIMSANGDIDVFASILEMT